MFKKLGYKIIAGYVLLIVLMGIVAGLAYWGLVRIETLDELALERQTNITDLWAMEAYTLEQANQPAHLIINDDPNAIEAFDASAEAMDEKMALVQKAVDTDQERQLMADLAELNEKVHILFRNQIIPAWEARDQELLKNFDEQNDELLVQIDDKIHQMVNSFETEVTEARNKAEEAHQQTMWLMASTSVIAAIVGLVFGFFLSRSITGPVQTVAKTASQLADQDLPRLVQAMQATAEGDLTATYQLRPDFVDVRTRDEVGQMGLAFNSMNEALGTVGQNFAKMLVNLRNLVGQVQQSAAQVATASQQLNASADQAGLASQQVASTSQQVAQGTTQQAQSITEASSNVEQMARAADGVARGAQEQARSVETTSKLISEMADIVDHVRGRTADAVGKVKEMESCSKEIGRIVETIDDIADKTDMLALNAAVEAARAGEHGRGFAVVADQVRKLSEDSKGATRDIADLIERVQNTVDEAIAAIEGTATHVDDAASGIGRAVVELKQKSEGVVAAIESVSTVVEENTAVAEEMAANTEEVTTAMSGIASIAEENSSATEEVSASAEEMSAQVEEVVASAEELAALAEELRSAATQFRVNGSERVDRRRAESATEADVSANGQPLEPVPVLGNGQGDASSPTW
jgi:methyl-accepting chemotaxis protein